MCLPIFKIIFYIFSENFGLTLEFLPDDNTVIRVSYNYFGASFTHNGSYKIKKLSVGIN